MSPDALTAAERRACALIDAFVAADYEALRRAGDPAFAAALRPAALAAVRADLGALRAPPGAHAQVRDSLFLVEAHAEFESGPVVFRIALREGELAGFFVSPCAPPAPEWRAPNYVDLDRVSEREISVGPLPATLTLPKGVVRPPVCLFVHGSGPGDRDQTVGPNKPFRDLAQGLATRGVASLRYDKRTRVLPQSLTAITAPTVKDETLDDVAFALRLLSGCSDFGAIVVVGHSLGALLGPRIAECHPEVAAVVMMAAPARPLIDVTLEQLEYLDSLKPSGQIETLRAEAERVRAARPGDEGAPFLGAPLSWWADLNAYDALAAASRIATPLLILHAGRDYQVRDADFDLWRAGLANRPRALLRRFAKLNHLMMAGEGLSQPAEYQVAGHVDADVVQAIAAFALGA